MNLVEEKAPHTSGKLFSRPFVSLTQGAKIAEKGKNMSFKGKDISPH